MKEFKTQKTYLKYKDMFMQNWNATKQWMKENKTNGIPVNVAKTFPFDDKINNDIRSAIETWEFAHDIPSRYFLYINEKNNTATTWTGQKLGSVSFGSPFRSNLGDTRQQITVKAINGKVYHGVYYKSAGDYARIKLAKNQ